MLSIFKRKQDPLENLKQVLGDRELPSFPAVIAQVLQIVRNTDRPLSDAGEKIQADPGLTVRILTTVNSAAFSLRHEVRSIHHAMSLLGRNQVESILIASAVRDSIPNTPAPGFEATRFWRTSATRALLASHLANLFDPSRRSESFTASLLQDMAVPLLAQERHEDYGPVLHCHHTEGGLLCELEQAAFGWDHARVGTWVCKSWEFPKVLTDAIGTHHGTGDETMEDLPAVRHVAAIPEVRPEEQRDALIDGVHAEFGIATSKVAMLLDTSAEEGEELARLFA